MPTQGPRDQEFSKRRIEHALRSKSLLQARGRAKDASVGANVLAQHDHIGIILHRASERQIDGFHQRYLRHRALLRAHDAGGIDLG